MGLGPNPISSTSPQVGSLQVRCSKWQRGAWQSPFLETQSNCVAPKFPRSKATVKGLAHSTSLKSIKTEFTEAAMREIAGRGLAQSPFLTKLLSWDSSKLPCSNEQRGASPKLLSRNGIIEVPQFETYKFIVALVDDVVGTAKCGSNVSLGDATPQNQRQIYVGHAKPQHRH